MLMTLNRDMVVVSRSGLSVRFKKGEPTSVPPRVVQEVIALGGEIVDKDQDVVQSTMGELQAADTEFANREPTIMTAVKRMLERNRRGDFTAGGRPNLSVLFRETGLTVDATEMEKVWEKVKLEIQ